MLMRVCLAVELRYIIIIMVYDYFALQGYTFYLTWRRTNLRVVELSASHDRQMSIYYQLDVVLIY